MHTRTPTERHRRTETTGYPSCGCVPAEPHSVSPVDFRIHCRQFQFNTSSNTETHASKNPTSLSTHCTKFEFENLFSNLSLTLFKTVADPFCPPLCALSHTCSGRPWARCARKLASATNPAESWLNCPTSAQWTWCYPLAPVRKSGLAAFQNPPITIKSSSKNSDSNCPPK